MLLHLNCELNDIYMSLCLTTSRVSTGDLETTLSIALTIISSSMEASPLVAVALALAAAGAAALFVLSEPLKYSDMSVSSSSAVFFVGRALRARPFFLLAPALPASPFLALFCLLDAADLG